MGEDGIEFLADTGANVTLTNKKPPKGTEILKEDIYIGTARADKLMHFKQKYNLQLQAPSGDVFDFEGMLLSEEAKQPLLPVGVMCDAGLLFLFSKECMRVYREENFKVSGTKIAEELRDEAKLYKWTLYPVKAEKHIVATAKALLQEGKRRLERGERKERERKAFMARLKDRAWKGKDASAGGNEDSTRITYSSGGDTR